MNKINEKVARGFWLACDCGGGYFSKNTNDEAVCNSCHKDIERKKFSDCIEMVLPAQFLSG